MRLFTYTSYINTAEGGRDNLRCHVRETAWEDGVSAVFIKALCRDSADGTDHSIHSEQGVVIQACAAVHRHGTSIIKSCESQMRRQMIRHESVLYYMKHYLYINRFQQLAAKVWFGGILAEIWLAGAGKAVIGGVRKGPGRVLRGRQETGRPV